MSPVRWVHLLSASLCVALLGACSTGGDPSGGNGEMSLSAGYPATSTYGDEGASSSVTGWDTGWESATGSWPGDPLTDSTTGEVEDENASCPPGSADCPCNDGGCGFGLVCVKNKCLPKIECDQDDLEPNNAETEAAYLGTIDDRDETGRVFEAHIGLEEVDWYSYFGADTIWGRVNPNANITSNGEIRVCKYVHCQAGLAATVLEECVAGSNSTSGEGRPGCCSTGGQVALKFNCSGVASDDATIFMSVSDPGAQCVGYRIAYHY